MHTYLIFVILLVIAAALIVVGVALLNTPAAFMVAGLAIGAGAYGALVDADETDDTDDTDVEA